jgi:hypothetical protein
MNRFGGFAAKTVDHIDFLQPRPSGVPGDIFGHRKHADGVPMRLAQSAIAHLQSAIALVLFQATCLAIGSMQMAFRCGKHNLQSHICNLQLH